MKNRLSFLLVVVWVITGILCLGLGIREAVLQTGKQYFFLFIMAAVAFGFAWYRYSGGRKE